MIEAGAGAWDPEETAPALAHLVAATAHAHVDIEEGSNSSGEEGSVAKKDGATTALRAASAMLLSGREDCRYAAANALADALIAPAASHPAADYARCLLPAAAAESSSRISCESVNRGSRVGGSLGRAAAAEPRPAPPGTELTQFTCDRCDKSPVLGVRWHCTRCPDFDLCDECHRESRSSGGSSGALYPSLHSASHPMICYRVGPRRVPGSGSAVAGSGADEAELAAASGGFGGLEGFGLRSGPPLRPTSEGKLPRPPRSPLRRPTTPFRVARRSFRRTLCSSAGSSPCLNTRRPSRRRSWRRRRTPPPRRQPPPRTGRRFPPPKMRGKRRKSFCCGSRCSPRCSPPRRARPRVHPPGTSNRRASRSRVICSSWPRR